MSQDCLIDVDDYEDDEDEDDEDWCMMCGEARPCDCDRGDDDDSEEWEF